MSDEGTEDSTVPSGWTFLTNHAHVLVCIATEPDMRGRDIAQRVGITERAAQGIIADLVAGGYVTRTREGRRNRYTLNPELPLRHPLEREHSVGELLEALGRSLAPQQHVDAAPSHASGSTPAEQSLDQLDDRRAAG